MKIFFFFIGVPTPIFETELELIRNHEKSGDIIYVFQCTGNLADCHWNKGHLQSKCAECRSRFKKGWSVLNPGQNVILKHFPVNTLNPSMLPQDFDSVEELKMFRYDGEKIGYGVASSLISRYRDHRFGTHFYRQEVRRTLTASAQVYDTLKQEFKKINPERVYIFNGRIANHLPALLLCKRMGIEFYTYEVSPSKNHYVLRKNVIIHDISVAHREMEETWSAGGADRKKIAKLWFEKKRAGIKNYNLTSFTQHQKKGLLPDGFDPDKKNIAIFNGTIDEYAAIEDFKNPIYSLDETSGVRRILEAFEHDNRYMFYLRAHPNMKKISRSKNSQLRDIDTLASKFSNLHVIWPAEIIDSYALMDACEKIITFGSTMGIEAAYWGKPSILASGHGIYRYLGGVYVPKTHEELVNLLMQDDLLPLPADSILKYGYRELSPHTGIPFKYFKQTGSHSEIFDGVVIKSDTLAFRRSIYAVKNIAIGELFTNDNIRIIRPAYGLPPRDFSKILAKRAKVTIKKGTPLKWSLTE